MHGMEHNDCTDIIICNNKTSEEEIMMSHGRNDCNTKGNGGTQRIKKDWEVWDRGSDDKDNIVK